MKTLTGLLKEKKVIISCGTGGVGKTTTSAALAIAAAELGRNTIVITIDPAKRLATSLGLQMESQDPTDITEKVGIKGGGRLYALMPDSEHTFENFIRSMAGKNQGLAAKILKTSIYKIFAQEFSGTNEYLAMEKLFELYDSGKYDLIILDTPPSSNTLAFLQAPEKLAQFFDDKMIRWFVEPGSKLLAAGLKITLEILERLTGKGFIAELLEFTSGLFELRAEFIDNLKQVTLLLKKPEVAYLMITSPEKILKEDTQDFIGYLKKENYPFWGFILNRCLSKTLQLDPSHLPDDATLIGGARSAGATESEAQAMLENYRISGKQLQLESEAFRYIRSLDGELRGEVSSHRISEQPTDVHSVEGLKRISQEFANE